MINVVDKVVEKIKTFYIQQILFSKTVPVMR